MTDPRSSPPSPETPLDLEQRFELKAAVIRLREASAIRGSGHIWPTDVIAVLDELDRLMLVNGQIAMKWAEAEDRAEHAESIILSPEAVATFREESAASPRSSLTAPAELNEALDELCPRYGVPAGFMERSPTYANSLAARSKVEEMYKALQEQAASDLQLARELSTARDHLVAQTRALEKESGEWRRLAELWERETTIRDEQLSALRRERDEPAKKV